jgi:hypothetical protein
MNFSAPAPTDVLSDTFGISSYMSPPLPDSVMAGQGLGMLQPHLQAIKAELLLVALRPEPFGLPHCRQSTTPIGFRCARWTLSYV